MLRTKKGWDRMQKDEKFQDWVWEKFSYTDDVEEIEKAIDNLEEDEWWKLYEEFNGMEDEPEAYQCSICQGSNCNC